MIVVNVESPEAERTTHTVQYLEDGIFELRIGFENRIARSFYFYGAERQIIFTHGFVKKAQKTPKGEIARTKVIRQSWRDE